MVSQAPLEYLLLGAAVLLLVSILASKASGRLGVPALAALPGHRHAGRVGRAGRHLLRRPAAGAVRRRHRAGLHPLLRRPGHRLAAHPAGVGPGPGAVHRRRAADRGADGPVRASWCWASRRCKGCCWAPSSPPPMRPPSSPCSALAACSLREPLEPLLELESGSNDPMAVFLTVGLIELLDSSRHARSCASCRQFVQQMVLGAAPGLRHGPGDGLDRQPRAAARTRGCIRC